MLGEYVQKLIDDLNVKIEEIKPQLQEIKSIYCLLQDFKKRTGAPFEVPDLGWLLSDQSETKEPKVGQQGPVIRPDTFYGKSITEAAEKYLRPIRHAVSGDEIYAAVSRGGLSADRKAFNDTLTRAVRKFKKFGTGSGASFGLIEWYPKKRAKKDDGDQERDAEPSTPAEETQKIEGEKEDNPPFES